MKKRFLLNGIALHPANISPRHVESPPAVVTYLANPRLPVRDRTAMPARITAHPIAVELLIKLPLPHLLIDDIPKRSHQKASN
jgi:hypothetical protein